MKAHVKYAQARDQLYHLVVLWHRCLHDAKVLHPTPQYRQAVEMATAVLENSRDAFERGNILEVLINEYVPTPLPGFEEFVTKAREAAKWDLPPAGEEIEAVLAENLRAILSYELDDPFDGVADWENYDSPPPDGEDGDESPGYDPFEGKADFDV